MAQFDVYKNPGSRTSKQAPYLVEVQGRFVESLATCVVIPLVETRYKEGRLEIMNSTSPCTRQSNHVTRPPSDHLLYYRKRFRKAFRTV